MHKVLDLVKSSLKQKGEEYDKEYKLYHDGTACECRDNLQTLNQKFTLADKKYKKYTGIKEAADTAQMKAEAAKSEQKADQETADSDRKANTSELKAHLKKSNKEKQDFANMLTAITKAIDIVRGGRKDIQFLTVAMEKMTMAVSPALAGKFASLMQYMETPHAKRGDAVSAVINMLEDLRKDTETARQEHGADADKTTSDMQQTIDTLTQEFQRAKELFNRHFEEEMDAKAKMEKYNDQANQEKLNMEDSQRLIKSTDDDCKKSAKEMDEATAIWNDEEKNLKVAQSKIEAGIASQGSGFLQLSEFRAPRDEERAERRAMKLLARATRKTKDALLATTLLQAEEAGSFDTIIDMISKLISDLENARTDEANKGGKCSDDLKNSRKEIQEAQANLETANAQIATATADLQDANERISDNNEEIAYLSKSQTKADARFAQLKQLLNQAIDEDTESKKQLDDAKNFLQNITSGKNTEGAGGALAGVIDLLGSVSAKQGIIFDLHESIENNKAFLQEKEASHDKETQERSDKTSACKDALDTAKADAAGAKKSQIEGGDKNDSANKNLDNAAAVMKKLKETCIAGESFEDRTKKRKQEIEALEDALTELRKHDQE